MKKSFKLVALAFVTTFAFASCRSKPGANTVDSLRLIDSAKKHGLVVDSTADTSKKMKKDTARKK